MGANPLDEDGPYESWRDSSICNATGTFNSASTSSPNPALDPASSRRSRSNRKAPRLVAPEGSPQPRRGPTAASASVSVSRMTPAETASTSYQGRGLQTAWPTPSGATCDAEPALILPHASMESGAAVVPMGSETAVVVSSSDGSSGTADRAAVCSTCNRLCCAARSICSGQLATPAAVATADGVGSSSPPTPGPSAAARPRQPSAGSTPSIPAPCAPAATPPSSSSPSSPPDARAAAAVPPTIIDHAGTATYAAAAEEEGASDNPLLYCDAYAFITITPGAHSSTASRDPGPTATTTAASAPTTSHTLAPTTTRALATSTSQLSNARSLAPNPAPSDEEQLLRKIGQELVGTAAMARQCYIYIKQARVHEVKDAGGADVRWVEKGVLLLLQPTGLNTWRLASRQPVCRKVTTMHIPAAELQTELEAAASGNPGEAVQQCFRELVATMAVWRRFLSAGAAARWLQPPLGWDVQRLAGAADMPATYAVVVYSRWEEAGTMLQVARAALAAPPEVYLRRMAGLVVQLAEAGALLRRLGIVHGDLKPENTLVRADGQLLLIDWDGVAFLDPAALRERELAAAREAAAAAEQRFEAARKELEDARRAAASAMPWGVVAAHVAMRVAERASCDACLTAQAAARRAAELEASVATVPFPPGIYTVQYAAPEMRLREGLTSPGALQAGEVPPEERAQERTPGLDPVLRSSLVPGDGVDEAVQELLQHRRGAPWMCLASNTWLVGAAIRKLLRAVEEPAGLEALRFRERALRLAEACMALRPWDRPPVQDVAARLRALWREEMGDERQG